MGGYEKYTQTQRLEQCMYPSAPCSYIDQTKLASQCLQKHNFVRLLAYTYEDGLHIDSFKLPVACSCHVGRRKRDYFTPVPTHKPRTTTLPPLYLPQLVHTSPSSHGSVLPPALPLPTPQPLQHSPSPSPYSVLLGK